MYIYVHIYIYMCSFLFARHKWAESPRKERVTYMGRSSLPLTVTARPTTAALTPTTAARTPIHTFFLFLFFCVFLSLVRTVGPAPMAVLSWPR